MRILLIDINPFKEPVTPISLGNEMADDLRRIAVAGYDWQSVATRLAEAAGAVRQAAITS